MTKIRQGNSNKKYCFLSLTGYQQSLNEGFITNEFPGLKPVNQILTDQVRLRGETRLTQGKAHLGEIQ